MPVGALSEVPELGARQDGVFATKGIPLRRRPPAPRMLCGWRSVAKLTAAKDAGAFCALLATPGAPLEACSRRVGPEAEVLSGYPLKVLPILPLRRQGPGAVRPKVTNGNRRKSVLVDEYTGIPKDTGIPKVRSRQAVVWRCSPSKAGSELLALRRATLQSGSPAAGRSS